MLSLFCPDCLTYFPSGAACPGCGLVRLSLQAPTLPGAAAWCGRAPGSVGSQLAVTRAGERTLLIVPWASAPRRGEAGAPDGGLAAFDLAGGSPAWSRPLGAPVEGGVAVLPETPDAPPGLVAGLARRGPGAGEGWLVALDPASGRELWPRRAAAGGAVRGAPGAHHNRVFATAGDGTLVCLDARNGQSVWRAPLADRPVPVPAGPLLVRGRGTLQAIVVGSYGSGHGREEGRLVAFDEAGHMLWSQPAGGQVRGAPVYADGLVFVAAYREHPSAGVLTAFEARTGRPAWRQPFLVQGGAGTSGPALHSFSAAPLAHDGRVYVGSLNHHMYALEAASGRLLWEQSAGGGIATCPAWVEGLIVFGANDGRLYALEAGDGQPVWQYDLASCPDDEGRAGHVLTDPLAWEGLILAGADTGALAALPWHLGRYEWAAARLEAAARHDEAGDCRALAAHFSGQPFARCQETYQLAAGDWLQTGQLDKAIRLWQALDQCELLAEACRAAGERLKLDDRPRAAAYFRRAADAYFPMRRSGQLSACTRALASCAGLSYLSLQAVNVGTFVQWREDELTLRLTNLGQATLPAGVRLWLGGALRTPAAADIKAALPPGAAWNIPLKVTPTRAESEVWVEIEYDPGVPEFAPLRDMLVIRIQAIEPPREPQKIEVSGDVLNLTIGPATREGVAITMRDVASLRSEGDIRQVHVTGDTGALVAHRDLGQATVGGDVGLLRGGVREAGPPSASREGQAD